MQRAFIVTGVLSLGTVLVFGAAMLASVLFPNGGMVATGWGSVGGVRPIAVPAPAVEPGFNVDGKDVVVDGKGVVEGEPDGVIVDRP